MSVGTRIENGVAPWAAIWINGENMGESTPKELELPAGRYEISVRRNGFTTPEARTVDLLPGFERRVVPVVFDLKKEGP